MAWVLLTVTGVLAVLVVVLAVLVLHLRTRLVALEVSVAAGSPSSDADSSFRTVETDKFASLDGRQQPAAPEFVITRVGEQDGDEEEAEPAATVPAPVFAD